MQSLAVSATLLRTFPLFARFSDATLHELLPKIQHRSYSRNSSILRAGEKSNALYAIVSGKVKIVIDDGEGREATLTIMGPGELFGEMSCIDGKPRSASVVALEHCEVLYVPSSALVACLSHNFDAAMYLLTIAVGRLRGADEKIAALALMDVRGRVARLLLDTAHPVAGEWVVDIGAEEIARTVGASREMVSRVVKQMIEAGLLRRDKRKIVVLDRSSLPTASAVLH